MTLTLPVVSMFTAGVLIIMQMVLMLSVVLGRRRLRQSLGDGDNPELTRLIRRHGNFAENAAIFVIASALLELATADRAGIGIICAGFVAGRICHAIGLSMKRTVNLPRTIGIVLSVAACLSLGVRLVRFALLNWP